MVMVWSLLYALTCNALGLMLEGVRNLALPRFRWWQSQNLTGSIAFAGPGAITVPGTRHPHLYRRGGAPPPARSPASPVAPRTRDRQAP